jgi:hypothetical protein
VLVRTFEKKTETSQRIRDAGSGHLLVHAALSCC